ncbi:hypothetical protein ELQ35_00070 [Peribacillus cavernae]|uniref:Uncharacterized protein n=1 Tax=Peribacillus cavernae TaxID=1674310 RepID=A0A3S0U7M5_9BACI|nr:hypothetical protein [Peribacillus cavernae]MDQ0217871.1 hypothetical protein [Peribacillus cavernae]RUQ32535.1 hypothetical protein ELQ35_00070 [Peribacillus cavernae]
MVLVHKKRNRYTVVVNGASGQLEPVVIIASNMQEMFNKLIKVHGHLLIDEEGNEVGTVQFRSNVLG